MYITISLAIFEIQKSFLPSFWNLYLAFFSLEESWLLWKTMIQYTGTGRRAISLDLWGWNSSTAQFSSVASAVLRPAKDDTSYSISVNSNNKEKMAFGTVYLYYSCDCSLYSIDAAIYICTVYEGQLSGQPVERDCCHARIF